MIKRYWFQASRSQLYLRITQLESELSVAAALLNSREEALESEGRTRSPIVSELLLKWRALLDAQPDLEEEEAA